MSDFFEQLEKFIGSLGTATSNMDGRVQLCEHEYVETMLDSLKTAADFTAAGKEIISHFNHFCHDLFEFV